MKKSDELYKINKVIGKCHNVLGKWIYEESTYQMEIITWAQKTTIAYIAHCHSVVNIPGIQ